MNLKTILMAVMANVIVLSTTVVSSSIAYASGDHPEEQEQHHEEEKGPNNGRLLTQGEFSLELVLFERGVAPEFRVYANFKHQKVKPQAVDLSIRLTRLGNVVDTISFSPQSDHLKGDAVIYEPHSFVVDVQATFQGKQYEWHFETFEGRTEISNTMALNMGVTTLSVGSQTLSQTLPVFGKLVLAPNSERHISARYPGEVKALNVQLGQSVKQGQHLLTIESNDSLQSYKVFAPISGVVNRQNIALGEQTGSANLLTISNTQTLMAELNVYPLDQDKIKPAAKVLISPSNSTEQFSTEITDALMAVNAQQAKVYRAKVHNVDGKLSVGQFIKADITVNTFTVDKAVKTSALQSFRDFTVAYEKVGEQYEVRMLTLGREAGEWVEVLSGIKAGSEYVTGNSYLIKADIDKAGAAHDH